MLTPRMLRTRSARCRVSSPSSVSLRAWSALYTVASWPSPISWSPESAGLTALPVSASELFSRRTSTPCLGLAPLVTAVCLGEVPELLVSDAVPHCGRGGGAVLGPPTLSLAPPLAPPASVARVAGGFRPIPSPVRPPPELYRPRWPLQGFLPPGAMRPLQGCRCPAATQLPPPTPWRSPPGFPPLHRPRSLLRIPSLQRSRLPLRRPCVPSLSLPLHRTCWPDFPAGRQSSPLPRF